MGKVVPSVSICCFPTRLNSSDGVPIIAVHLPGETCDEGCAFTAPFRGENLWNSKGYKSFVHIFGGMDAKKISREKCALEKEIDLFTIWSVFRSKFVLILLSAILLGAMAWAGTTFLIAPKYTASTTMYVYSNSNRTSSDSVAITASELSASQKLVDTYIVVLKSNVVLDQIIQNLKLNYTADELRKMISASSVNSTEMLSISVTTKSAQLSQNIANEIARVCPSEIIRVVKAGGVEVVDYAQQPDEPSSPNLERNVAIGLLFGFIISFGSFLLKELFNTKIRCEEDISNLFEIPVLGSIPQLPAVQSREGL